MGSLEFSGVCFLSAADTVEKTMVLGTTVLSSLGKATKLSTVCMILFKCGNKVYKKEFK